MASSSSISSSSFSTSENSINQDDNGAINVLMKDINLLFHNPTGIYPFICRIAMQELLNNRIQKGFANTDGYSTAKIDQELILIKKESLEETKIDSQWFKSNEKNKTWGKYLSLERKKYYSIGVDVNASLSKRSCKDSKKNKVDDIGFDYENGVFKSFMGIDEWMKKINVMEERGEVASSPFDWEVFELEKTDWWEDVYSGSSNGDSGGKDPPSWVEKDGGCSSQ